MLKKVVLNVLILFMIPFFMAAQGYYNQENFGNRSILLSGSVTGSVDDLGLTYYNPARLAIIEKPVFSINAKAYQYSSLNLKNVFGRDSKLDDSKFEGVPSLIAGTYKIEKWKKHYFAYAFLSKQRSRLGFNITREIDVNNNEIDADRLIANFTLDNNETDEWFGGSWAMKLKDNLSIGVSTFVSIYNYGTNYDLRASSLDETSGVDLFNNTIEFGQNSYGIFWKLGLAWHLEKIDLGLNIDLPYLEVFADGKFRYQNYVSGVDPENEEFQYYDYKNLDTTRKEPLAISFGLGLPLGKNILHFKADWHAGVSEYDRLVIPESEYDSGFAFTEALRSVINFGIGGEFYLNEELSLYASVSTDFSPVEASANIFDFINEGLDANFDEDYMHYGLGVNVQLKKMKLVVGATYSNASGEYGEAIQIPFIDSEPEISRISINRYRFILGLEIPIFGYDLEFK